MANMVRSSILDMCGSSPAGMTGSRAMIVAPGFAARRTFSRIWSARSSSQSWRTRDKR